MSELYRRLQALNVLRCAHLDPDVRVASAPKTAILAVYASTELEYFARSSALEGVLSKRPGTYSRSPMHIVNARKALSRGEPNDIVNGLEGMGLGPDQIQDWLSLIPGKGLYTMLEKGVWRGLNGTEPNGMTPPEITSALAVGVSPLTLKPFSKYNGGGVFFWLGAVYGPEFQPVFKTAFGEGKNRAFDVLRAGQAKKERLFQDVSFDRDQDQHYSPHSVLTDEKFSDNMLDELLETALNDPSFRRFVQSEAEKKWRSDDKKMKMIELVFADPNMLKLYEGPNKALRGTVVMDVRRFMQAWVAQGGTYADDKSFEVNVRKQFNTQVLPWLSELLANSSVVERMVQKRDLLDVYRAETRGRRGLHPSRTASIEDEEGLVARLKSRFARTLAGS